MTPTRSIDDDIVASGSARKMEERSASNRPAGGQAEMPLAAAPGMFQGGLFVLAILAALYAAREIILPIVLAVMLKLLLQPALRTLQRLRVQGRLVRCC